MQNISIYKSGTFDGMEGEVSYDGKVLTFDGKDIDGIHGNYTDYSVAPDKVTFTLATWGAPPSMVAYVRRQLAAMAA